MKIIQKDKTGKITVGHMDTSKTKKCELCKEKTIFVSQEFCFDCTHEWVKDYIRKSAYPNIKKELRNSLELLFGSVDGFLSSLNRKERSK